MADTDISEQIDDVETIHESEPFPDLVEDADVIDESPADSEPAEQSTARRGVLPLLLGGVVAGAIGFGSAQYLNNAGWPFPKDTTVMEDLRTKISDQSEQIQSLETRLTELGVEFEQIPIPEPLDEIMTGQSQLSETISATENTVVELDQRLTDLENRPIPDVGATASAVEAYEQELAAMRSMFQEKLEKMQASQAEAIEAQSVVAQRATSATELAAMAQVEAALQDGSSIDQALEDLDQLGIEIPSVLEAASKDGVVTLSWLQQAFPKAARAALGAANKAASDAGETSSISSFFKTQLGVRSLQPKDGDDADAVLSRAEAALLDGDIVGTLTQLNDLPAVAADSLQAWRGAAQNRLDVLSAASELSATINSQGR